MATDPDARLTWKPYHGAAFPGYQASVLMENRHGLIVQTDVRAPGGHADGDAAVELLTLLPPSPGRRTLEADRGYNGLAFIAEVHALGFTSPVSPNPRRYRGQRRMMTEANHPRHITSLAFSASCWEAMAPSVPRPSDGAIMEYPFP